jgi:ABC-type antimicrobial peptide transport system permease subunit
VICAILAVVGMGATRTGALHHLYFRNKGLGAAALVLSAVGLFGLTASLVARRRREMGVRLALGAVPGDLSRLVLRESLVLAIWGGALGLALAVWLGGLIESRLYGVSAFGPLSLMVAMAVLASAGLLAAWIPSRRAATVDPVWCWEWIRPTVCGLPFGRV